MKKEKVFQLILTLIIALSLILPGFSVFAEEAEGTAAGPEPVWVDEDGDGALTEGDADSGQQEEPSADYAGPSAENAGEEPSADNVSEDPAGENAEAVPPS